MSPGATRREALRRAVVGGGALALPPLLWPAIADAQDDEEPVLEDFLTEAIVIEQIAVLAYSSAAAALEGERDLAGTLRRFERQEQIHATALRSALDSLAIDLPAAPAAPDDAPAIEGAERLDDERAAELVELLGRVDGLEGRRAHLDYLIELENEQLGLYLREAPTLDAEDMLRTGAEIAACQSQHLVVLGVALGTAPAQAVPRLPQPEHAGVQSD